MDGARKALISRVMLGREFKHISFKSSKKIHPLGSFCVRKRCKYAQVLFPTGKRRGKAIGAFLLSLLGNSRLSTDTLPCGARLQTSARMVDSCPPGRNQPCQQKLLHQSILLPAGRHKERSRFHFSLTFFFFLLLYSQSLHFVVVLNL